MKKKKDEVIVRFIGNSAVDVTGSSVLISYKNHEYLIEFGLIQGNANMEKEYATNLQHSKNINIDNIKCVLLSHPHIDHIGLIPSLAKKGFDGEIYGSYESLEFANKLLEDCAFILNRNYLAIKKKGKNSEEIYGLNDVSKTINNMRSCDLNRVYKYDEYMSFQFVPNSHILGATQIIIWIRKTNGHVVKILYTGDLGSKLKTGCFLQDTEIVPNANLVICESTYFSNPKEFSKNDVKSERVGMKSKLLQTLGNGGKVIIPSFSYGRSQTLMLDIWNMFKDTDFDFDVIIDSRLTNRINKVYKEVLKDEDKSIWEQCLSWKNFKFVEKYNDTKHLIALKKPMVVISSNGMCNAGHVTEWVKNSIGNSKDLIMCVGYAPEDSVLTKMLNGEEVLKWDKAAYTVKCKIVKYNTYSSHLSAQGIIDYLKQINTPMIAFHHGSKEAKNTAVEMTKKEFDKMCKNANIFAVTNHMEIKL